MMKVMKVGWSIIILCFVLGMLFADGQSKPFFMLAFECGRTILASLSA